MGGESRGTESGREGEGGESSFMVERRKTDAKKFHNDNPPIYDSSPGYGASSGLASYDGWMDGIEAVLDQLNTTDSNLILYGRSGYQILSK